MTAEGSRTTWGEGDYPLMAKRLEAVARQVVELADVHAGDRVLDIATGTGNAAVLAADRGATTTAVDLEPALLRIGRQRTAERGTIQWLLGDATALPLPDGCADKVLSVFGVMYAGDHDEAASELARCTARHGHITLAAWAPGSFLPAMGSALAPYLPPPAGPPPSRWADPDALAHLLAPHGLQISHTQRGSLPLHFDDEDTATDFLLRTAGNVMREQPRLAREGRWQELRAVLRDFIHAAAVRRSNGVELRADYLLAQARHAGSAERGEVLGADDLE